MTVISVLEFIGEWFRRLNGTYKEIQEAMKTINGYAGIQVAVADYRGGWMYVPHGGATYRVFVLYVPQEQAAQVTVHSAVLFPRGGLPPAVWDGLQRMNERMLDCRYDRGNLNDQSTFTVRRWFTISELYPSSFMRSFANLVPHLDRLDNALAEHGYVQ